MCVPSAELKQKAVCTIIEQNCLSQQIVEKTKHENQHQGCYNEIGTYLLIRFIFGVKP